MFGITYSFLFTTGVNLCHPFKESFNYYCHFDGIVCLFRGSAYACLITFYSSRSWCSDVLQFIAFLHLICVSVIHHLIHFIFQDVQIDVCAVLNDTTGTLMSCAWKNFNCKIGLIVGMWTVGKSELLFAWCTSTVCWCMHFLVLWM